MSRPQISPPPRGPLAAATASDYFGGMAESYDSLITRAVPRYAEMTDRLLAYLPRGASRILELGCGTGNLTLRLRESFPGATITAVDAAPEMTALASGRMAELPGTGRFEAITERFEALGFEPASFNLVTSCISLHHVKDKGALYRGIHRWLAPGGTLRFADQFMGASAQIHAVNWSEWLAFCRRPGGCTEVEVQSLLDHAEAHDHYTPVAEHFDLLRAAGFGAVDCVWRNWIWGIVTADR